VEQAEFRGRVKHAMSLAAKDAAFRAAFAADPVAVVERDFQASPPEGFDADRFRTAVRARFGLAADEGELDDAALERVAGGGCHGCFNTCACNHP
jgi:hypothetical protein